MSATSTSSAKVATASAVSVIFAPTSLLRLRGVDDRHADAFGDVEHGFAVVALKFVPVQIQNEIGPHVGDARGDDQRVFHTVVDLDVGITATGSGSAIPVRS